jgi:hypothetical protein
MEDACWQGDGLSSSNSRLNSLLNEDDDGDDAFSSELSMIHAAFRDKGEGSTSFERWFDSLFSS